MDRFGIDYGPLLKYRNKDRSWEGLTVDDKVWLGNCVINRKYSAVTLSNRYNIPKSSIHKWVKTIRYGETFGEVDECAPIIDSQT
jgi:hypothetical protein